MNLALLSVYSNLLNNMQGFACQKLGKPAVRSGWFAMVCHPMTVEAILVHCLSISFAEEKNAAESFRRTWRCLAAINFLRRNTSTITSTSLPSCKTPGRFPADGGHGRPGDAMLLVASRNNNST